jgi:hypothetical protein
VSKIEVSAFGKEKRVYHSRKIKLPAVTIIGREAKKIAEKIFAHLSG